MAQKSADTGTLRTLVHSREALAKLLDFLPVLYPGGKEWLDRRLDDVERGDAHCILLYDGGELAGVSIGVLKPDNRFKICTLYVRPESRRVGGGSALLGEMLRISREHGGRETYITAAHTVSDELGRLLGAAGFSPVVTELHRYGDGRHETIFVARAER